MAHCVYASVYVSALCICGFGVKCRENKNNGKFRMGNRLTNMLDVNIAGREVESDKEKIFS